MDAVSGTGSGSPPADGPRSSVVAERVLFAPRHPVAPGPDAAADTDRYRRWIAARLAARMASPAPRRPAPDAKGSSGDPLIAFLMVLDDPRPWGLSGSLRSLHDQIDPGWELSVTAVGEPGPASRSVLDQGLGSLGADRHHGTAVAPGTGAATAAARAFRASRAPFVAVLGQHDRLDPDAVSLLRIALTDDEVDMAYGDEDRIDEFGCRLGPLLKPDWSPDLLLSLPYLGRPVALRRTTVEAAGGIEDVGDGDWEHDLVLRVSEQGRRIAHVPEVICQRGPAPAPTGDRAPRGDGAVVRALARRGECASVEPGPVAGSWRVRRRPFGPASVSAVIPLRDQPRLLRACVESVRATTAGCDLQLVLVDNGSEDPETLTLLERLDGAPDTTVVTDDRPFNWAALNNGAMTAARGDVLVFVNNDVVAHADGWLDRLTAQALRPDVGAVGARLLYPVGRLQHGGMVVGLGGAAGHVLVGLPADQPGYLGMAVLTRECSAVTGACMATRRAVFDELGRFDEALGLDLNDVDFCLKAGRAGYRVLYEPLAELVHHESPSRGTSQSASDIRRFLGRWEDLLAAGDPYLNPNLTRTDASCALRGADEQERWQTWRSTLPIS